MQRNKEFINALMKLIFRKNFMFIKLNKKLNRIYNIGENKNKENNKIII